MPLLENYTTVVVTSMFYSVDNSKAPKGQLISEWLFGVFNFPKKTSQKFGKVLP